MNNLIILVIGMTLAFIVGVFSCLKSVQIGLKFKIQIENKEIPTIDNPITEIKKANEESKANKEEAKLQAFTAKQVKEYLYGE